LHHLDRIDERLPLQFLSRLDRLSAARDFGVMHELQKGVAHQVRLRAADFAGVELPFVLDRGGDEHPLVVVGNRHVRHAADADAALPHRRIFRHARRLLEADADEVFPVDPFGKVAKHQHHDSRHQQRDQHHQSHAQLHRSFVHDLFAI